MPDASMTASTIASTTASTTAGPDRSDAPRTWAGNHLYSFERWHEPNRPEQLADIVSRARRVRVLGSRHCFNDIADVPDGDLVSLRGLPDEVEVDADRQVARVTAWSTYAEVARELHRQGWALPNTASLPHISIAGAIATGSHGSGVRNQGLGGPVVAIELLGPDGQPRLVRRGEPDFAGSVVALGALGVWTHVHLQVEPTFDVRQTVRLELPWSDVLADLDAVLSAAYSVSLFTDFRGPNAAQVWLKARADQAAPTLELGSPAQHRMVHMLTGGDPASVTMQLEVPGPWHERLPHFQAGFTPSRGAEIQSEYLLPREHAVTAIERLRGLSQRLESALQTAEIRTIAADDLWLSPAHDDDMAGFHFTWLLDQPLVDAAVGLVEDALLPLGARPHWGKAFHADAEALAGVYPRMADFAALRDRVDPDRVFDNPYLRRVLGS